MPSISSTTPGTAAPVIRPLRPADRDAYLHFFDHVAFADNPRWASCYCQFPTADHVAVPWKQRTAAENRAGACRRIDAGQQRGVIAEVDGQVVGWCNAGPWRSMTIMDDDEPGSQSERMGAITCFVVAPEWRGRGVASALLLGACDALREDGFEWIEAWTVPNAEGAAENHTGPASMYLKAGFVVFKDGVEGGMLVRKHLAPAA